MLGSSLEDDIAIGSPTCVHRRSQLQGIRHSQRSHDLRKQLLARLADCGSLIHNTAGAIFSDPEVFEEPEKFDPLRWFKPELSESKVFDLIFGSARVSLFINNPPQIIILKKPIAEGLPRTTSRQELDCKHAHLRQESADISSEPEHDEHPLGVQHISLHRPAHR